MRAKQLPAPFLESMRSLLGAEYETYLDSFEECRLFGLRVNEKKISREEFERIVPFSVTPVPWVPGGYFYEEAFRPARDPYYYAGLYYLQEPSAMTPAGLLPVKAGDALLDLCAAPGGKSTQLGARLSGGGMLVSNDISNTRAKALLKNLELFGIPDICVTSESPKKLAQAFPKFFDGILVDAPCSGEGMFRKDEEMTRSWEERGPEYYAPLQREIVSDAVSMLKPGGYLLYSTCTFSPLENEGTIRHLLETRGDMEIVPLALFKGAKSGVGLPGCLRLYPHRIKGEGHFIALLKKKEGDKVAEMSRPTGNTLTSLPLELEQFLGEVKRPFDRDRFMVKNSLVYYLPEGFFPKIPLRYLRTGLLVGELKRGRFEPSQALAMSLKREEFSVSVSLPREDDRVIRYLKGETLSLTEEEAPVRGWCLVCVDGFPLGFAKGAGNTLKNKYYPGWRWR